MRQPNILNQKVAGQRLTEGLIARYNGSTLASNVPEFPPGAVRKRRTVPSPDKRAHEYSAISSTRLFKTMTWGAALDTYYATTICNL